MNFRNNKLESTSWTNPEGMYPLCGLIHEWMYPNGTYPFRTYPLCGLIHVVDASRRDLSALRTDSRCGCIPKGLILSGLTHKWMYPNGTYPFRTDPRCGCIPKGHISLNRYSNYEVGIMKWELYSLSNNNSENPPWHRIHQYLDKSHGLL
jgi:hypothetical protein